MKNIKKIISTNLTESETDNYMSQILDQKFDKELKERYKEILSSKYNVNRAPVKKKIRFLYPIVAAVAASLALIFMFQFGNSTDGKNDDFRQMAVNYDLENPFSSKELMRGNSQGLESVVSARANFEQGNFDKVVTDLAIANLISKSDLFLLGYSQFRTKNYDSAHATFNKIISLDKETAYVAESEFYAILSLFAAGKKDEGNAKMNQLDKNTWSYLELQTVFKK